MYPINLDRPQPTVVNTPEAARELRDRIGRAGVAAIDTETDGLDISRSRPRFWSIATDLSNRYFLEDTMLPEFEQVFNDPKIEWIGTHTKFDAHMLKNAGFALNGSLYCTLVMDRLNNPDNDHGLKESYEREFQENVPSFGETFFPLNKSGKPYKPKNKSLLEILEEVWDQNPARVIEYASLDPWMSLRLFYRLQDKLDQVTATPGKTLWDIYWEFELPFTRVLFECEKRGVAIDTQYLQSLEPKMEEEKDKVAKKLAKLAGQVVNPNSPKQLQELFFGKLGLKPISWTSGGASGKKQPSVDVKVLSKYASNGVEPAQLILRYRKLTKMLGTYIHGILDRLGPDGRLHGSLNQHVTDTARLSSTDPNLQNIPKPGRDEFLIRKAFVASPGKVFLSADYAQLEMYIMAHFSRDPGLISNIKRGLDIHAGNAQLVWQYDYDELMEAKRAHSHNEKLTARQLQLLEARDYIKIIGFGQKRPN